MKDVDQPEKPVTSVTLKSVDSFYLLVHENWRWTIINVVNVVALSCGFVQAVLTSELNVRSVFQKFARPHHPPADLGTERMLRQNPSIGGQGPADDTFYMSKIIACEEICVYDYNPDSKSCRQIKVMFLSMTVEGTTRLQLR